jgi:hypothetical protein
MNKGTPGPWHVDCGEVVNAEGVSLIRANRDEPRTTPCERDRNIDLCAAAPELLAACEVAEDDLRARSEGRCKWTVRDQRAYEALRDAIAKAKGE